jgi:serine/threonine protein kinase
MILMEYAEGETLRQLLYTTKLTRAQIFNLFRQLMVALKHIHGMGLVHRDIKPDNIFVNKKTGRL